VFENEELFRLFGQKTFLFRTAEKVFLALAHEKTLLSAIEKKRLVIALSEKFLAGVQRGEVLFSSAKER
jgi:hypothetical protein